MKILLPREDTGYTDAQGPENRIPVEIAYENVEPSPTWEEHVLRGIRRLEHVGPEVMSARVTLARGNARRRTGDLFDVHVQLTVPGPDIVVSRSSSWHHESEELSTAIHEAFEKARRTLVERHAVRRGEVKVNEPLQVGAVTDLFPDYGFLRSSEGRIVYFHRNSVLDDEWKNLRVGDDVRFVDEPGDEGPQATTVRVVRAHDRGR